METFCVSFWIGQFLKVIFVCFAKNRSKYEVNILYMELIQSVGGYENIHDDDEYSPATQNKLKEQCKGKERKFNGI